MAPSLDVPGIGCDALILASGPEFEAPSSPARVVNPPSSLTRTLSRGSICRKPSSTACDSAEWYRCRWVELRLVGEELLPWFAGFLLALPYRIRIDFVALLNEDLILCSQFDHLISLIFARRSDSSAWSRAVFSSV